MCVAIPGKILSLTNETAVGRAGRVDFSGLVREVNLANVPGAGIGDYVIVHAGCAMSTLDEDEARLILEYLERLDELAEADALA